MKTFFFNNKSSLLLVSFFVFIRVLVSFNFELGTDEAHYVLYGKNLALSYFDHPPLVGWVQSLFQYFSSLPIQFVSRLPAIFSSAASTLLINEWLRRKNYSEKHRLFALFGLNTALLFSALSFFFLPDSLLLILVPLLSLTVDNLNKNNSLKNWFFFSITLGLAGLTKYTAVLFLVPVIWYWLYTKRLKDLMTLNFWLALALALIVISPVLIWNLKHDFISFKYQTGHVISFQTINLSTFFLAQLSQFIGLGFLYLFGFPKVKSTQDRFDFYLLMTPLVFFSFFALFENFLPHWTAPYFVLAIPWGVAEHLQRNLKMTKRLFTALTFGTVLFVFIHLELSLHILPISAAKDLTRDIQGWQDFTKRSLTKSEYPLAVTNWTFGSRVKLYSDLAGKPFTTVLDKRTDQFDLWEKDYPPNSNYLILIEKKNETEFLNSIHCDSEKQIGLDGPIFKNEILVEFTLLECTGFSWK